MYKYLFLSFISFVLIACGGEESSETSNDMEEVEMDTTNSDANYSGIWEDEDSTSFFDFIRTIADEDSQDLMDDIGYMEMEMMNDFNAIQTAEELKEFYFGSLEYYYDIIQDLTWGDGYYAEGDWDEWMKLNEALPFYDAGSYEAEGQFGVVINAYPFYEKAKETEEDDDDIYFEAVMRFNNGMEEANDFIVLGYGGSYTFYTHSCDWCSESMLGSGVFEYVLEITQNCTDSTNIFQKELYELEGRAVDDLEFDCYVETQENVLAELERIATNIKMPKDHMQEVYDAINSVDDGSGLTFNGECEWENW